MRPAEEKPEGGLALHSGADAAPKRILFINVSRIGDTILATPAMRALATCWPDAKLDFLGHPNRFEIIAHLPFVASAGPITKNRAPFMGRLGGRVWDLAVVCGFDQPLVAYGLRVARRVAAFSQNDASLNARLHRCIERLAFQAGHAVDVPLTITRALGVPDAGRRLAYQVTQEERRWAKEVLASRGIGAARPLIGLQVASFPTKAFRDWPIGQFGELCERIAGRWPQAHFLIFGGALEQARTRSLADSLGSRATLFAGTLTLRQSAALMNEIDLYVGVDTGPTHMMGALEAPMVPLYHCYSPSRLLAPLERPNCYVVDHPRAGGACSEQTPMGEIEVDTVWRRVLEALA